MRYQKTFLIWRKTGTAKYRKHTELLVGVTIMIFMIWSAKLSDVKYKENTLKQAPQKHQILLTGVLVRLTADFSS